MCYSCVEGIDKDGIIDDLDKRPTVKRPAKNQGCPVPQSIKKVHLYLDNSASMAGYHNGATGYKDIITDLAIKIDRKIRPIDINFISKRTYPL